MAKHYVKNLGGTDKIADLLTRAEFTAEFTAAQILAMLNTLTTIGISANILKFLKQSDPHEGGQFEMEISSGSTLAGNIQVDVFDNYIRIFENGGSFRGIKIDLSACAGQTDLLATFTSGAKGLVPASGGGVANFLRADGSFAAPPSTITNVASAGASSGTTASITNIPACKILIVGYRNISHDNGANQTLRFALSTNNGSSYGTAQNMFSTAVGAAVSGSGVLMIMRMDATSVFIFQSSFAGQILGGVETGTSGTVNAIQFSWSAGNFDDGSGGFFAYCM